MAADPSKPDTKPTSAGKATLRTFETAWGEEHEYRLLVRYQYDSDTKEGFFVWLDEDLDVDWETSDEFQIDEIEGLPAVLNRAAVLESYPVRNLSEAHRIACRRMIAESIARALEGHAEQAVAMLNAANEYISRRTQETGRVWYIQSAALSGALCALLLLFAWHKRESSYTAWGQEFTQLFLGALAGGVGALFWILLRVGSSPVDCNAGRYIHYLEGAARIAVGVIGAIIANLAVRNGLILSVVRANHDPTASAVLVGLIAGASEYLVPSFIQRVEVTSSETRRTETTTSIPLQSNDGGTDSAD